LDDIVDDVISRFINPEEWQKEPELEGRATHAAR